MRVAKVERGLRGGHADDDNLIQPVGVTECLHVCVNALERRSGSLGTLSFGQVREPANRGAGVQHRTGAYIGSPALQVRQTCLDDVVGKYVGALVQLPYCLLVSGAANIMPAHDELAWLIQVEAVKQRQRR